MRSERDKKATGSLKKMRMTILQVEMPKTREVKNSRRLPHLRLSHLSHKDSRQLSR